MTEDQIDTINTVQEVLRRLTLALVAANPAARAQTAYLLRAAEADSTASPVAASMLGDLAKGLELIETPGPGH